MTPRIGRTYPNPSPSGRQRSRRGAGAPNIIVVLLDDMGYSDVGPFGSEISTPTLDRLAERGVRLTNYHTAAVCSPARAALMTGLNPHRAGYGFVASRDIGFPGYAMEIAEDVLTLPEILRQAGYATFAVGKWHLSRDAVMHDAAAHGSWPIQRGFDRYFGCLEGFTNLFHPNRLMVDNSPLEVDQYPRRLLPDRRADRPRDLDAQVASRSRRSKAVFSVRRAQRGARSARRQARRHGEISRSIRRRVGRAARGALRAPATAGPVSERHAVGAAQHRARPGGAALG